MSVIASPSGSTEPLSTEAVARQADEAVAVTFLQSASGAWLTAVDIGGSPSGLPPGPSLKVVNGTSGTWPTPSFDQSHTPVGNTAASRICWSVVNVAPP